MDSERIQFQESNEPFHAHERPADFSWFDTSFSISPRAVGDFRLVGVDNGRYERKHPVLNAAGDTIGLLIDAESLIGYTWVCVYARGCFWVANQTFHSTMNGGGTSVSLIGESGQFLFKPEKKFQVVKSFDFDGLWAQSCEIFKLLDDGKYILYLTKYGFCLFDTGARDIASKVEFSNQEWFYGFDLSPKVKLLAVCHCASSEKDPIDGERRYKSFLRLYNVESGKIVGEQLLQSPRDEVWKVEFSETGRQVRVSSNSDKRIFELTAE